MKFVWTALIVAFSAAGGVIGVAYLLGDRHVSETSVGFLVALAVFVAGVEHLSEKADGITNAIRSVQAVVEEDVEESVQDQ